MDLYFYSFDIYHYVTSIHSILNSDPIALSCFTTKIIRTTISLHFSSMEDFLFCILVMESNSFLRTKICKMMFVSYINPYLSNEELLLWDRAISEAKLNWRQLFVFCKSSIGIRNDFRKLDIKGGLNSFESFKWKVASFFINDSISWRMRIT